MQQVNQRRAVVWKWRYIALVVWLQQRGVFGEFLERQGHLDMMDAMEGLVKQRERQQAPGPAVSHDAAGRVVGESDVLDVLPPALKISGDHFRNSEVLPLD